MLIPIQVRTDEQRKQVVGILMQTTICRFAVSKLALDNPENTLYLTAYGGLAALNPPFPVDGTVKYMGQAFGSAVDAEINAGEVLVFLKFRALGDAEITRIAIDGLVILSEQLGRNGNIVDIGRCHLRGVDISASCVYVHMTFHAKPPLSTLLGLVHFGVTGFFGILCGAGGIDDGGIHDGTALHDVAAGHHDAVDGV